VLIKKAPIENFQLALLICISFLIVIRVNYGFNHHNNGLKVLLFFLLEMLKLD